MIRQVFFVAIVIVGPTLITAGQTDNNGSAPATVGSDLPYGEPLAPPMPVSGVRVPLRLSSETPRSNYLSGSIAVSAAYDDNMLSSPTVRVGDINYLFAPSLDIVQSRGRWNWDFGYSPGFTINQRFNERNQSAHDLHLLLEYRLSPHVNLEVHDNFSKTTTLFSTFMPVESGQPGPLQQPNSSPITPLANRTGNTSGLDLTYQFGRDSIVGGSGGYYFVNYGAVEGMSGQNYGLIDTRSWATDGFYAHRFANRHWLGVIYNFQRLMFDPGLRTDVQRTLVFYSIGFGSQMTFSLWAGPERSASILPRLVPLSPVRSFTHWFPAGGATWSWAGTRTGFSLGYRCQTSDGGGLMAAVRMQTADADIRRRLTRRWTASVRALYAINDPLQSFSLTSGTRTVSGTVGLDYRMTEHLELGMRYGRDRQEYPDVIPSLPANRNSGSFSIVYSFGRPLGR